MRLGKTNCVDCGVIGKSQKCVLGLLYLYDERAVPIDFGANARSLSDRGFFSLFMKRK